VLGLALAAIGSFILLAVVERRADQPVLLPELLGNSGFIVGAAVIALATMALFAAIVFLPLMFQLLMDASPTQAGLMLATMMGGVIVASVVGGRLVSGTGGTRSFPSSGCWRPHSPTPRSRGPCGMGSTQCLSRRCWWRWGLELAS
jgi:predicted MFS family arabinose efflux permease